MVKQLIAETEQEIEEKIIKIADENDLKLDKQVFHFFLEGYRHFDTFFYTACKTHVTEQDNYLVKRRKTLKISNCNEYVRFQFNNNIEESFCFHCMIDNLVKQLGWYEKLLERDINNGRIKLYQ